MKKIVISFIFLILTFSASTQDSKKNVYGKSQVLSSGTNLRGQVQLINNNTYRPYVGVGVCLYQFVNNKWIQIACTVTNQNGYYFFYRIPPNNYYIQVNWKNNYIVQVKNIDNRSFQFQDIPVLYYRIN